MTGADIGRVLAELADTGIGRADLVGIAAAPRLGVGVSAGGREWVGGPTHAPAVITGIESALRPRWAWWGSSTAVSLTADGVQVGRCWDLAAVHRLLFGGWTVEPGLIWACSA